MKKKKIFYKIFCSIHIFLELPRLVDDLVDFLGLSVFINASLSEIYYLMKRIGEKTFC